MAFAEVAAIHQMFAYNRKQEQEADLDGIRWMADGGYDAGGALAVWRKLVAELDALEGDRGFSLLSTPCTQETHPLLTEAAKGVSLLESASGHLTNLSTMGAP